MKKYYVYEIVNLMGTIEYVGESINAIERFKQHKLGKFYKRPDVFLNIVAEFNNRKDAYEYQCELQKKYGLEKTLKELLP